MYAIWKVRAITNKESIVPRREPRVRDRRPNRSTNHNPRKVPKKFMEDVAADNQIAKDLSVIPAMVMIDAL
ncbi:hypothetical protein E2C01_022100 [Portunus trituberculatus]|uniref:Uncharacterized protein n=1 Tax=Portunus trituberculatus TaxID=210409 RepID=A0A5B7E6C4_PORTR|nr:hypothetical protein [Portunus trituberculatus]